MKIKIPKWIIISVLIILFLVAWTFMQPLYFSFVNLFPDSELLGIIALIIDSLMFLVMPILIWRRFK